MVIETYTCNIYRLLQHLVRAIIDSIFTEVNITLAKFKTLSISLSLKRENIVKVMLAQRDIRKERAI